MLRWALGWHNPNHSHSHCCSRFILSSAWRSVWLSLEFGRGWEMREIALLAVLLLGLAALLLRPRSSAAQVVARCDLPGSWSKQRSALAIER
jgi:hypothetical protein